MSDNTPIFNFPATCIGSVPFQDIEDTCQNILRLFPKMPFWPQFVKRGFVEDMSAQYSEGLPLLDVNEKEKTLLLSRTKHAGSELTTFYEHFLAQDLDYFALSEHYAPGLYTLLDLMAQSKGPGGGFIKGQTVGPITFASGILDMNGKALIHNEELLEAMVNGLAIKALWQVRQLEKTERRVILFMDEPSLTGFGSAFSAIQRHEVIRILKKIMGYLRDNSNVLIGIHCCGNTDWPMLMEAGPDIINLDAFAYMDHFLLYPDEIERYLESGGTVAWGIVPTADFTGNESVDGLFTKLETGFGRIYEWGIDSRLLAERSLLTPACGMGTVSPTDAENGMDLLYRLSEKYQKMACILKATRHNRNCF